jgi:hypothetical protein
MKIILVVFMFLVNAIACAGDPPTKETDADRFVKEFVKWAEHGKKNTITDQQKTVLHDIFPLLVEFMNLGATAKDPARIMNFKENLKIDWEKAEKLMRSGKVYAVTQWHSLNVELYSRDGRVYETKEPKIDDIYHIVLEIDPKGVFILYSTE